MPESCLAAYGRIEVISAEESKEQDTVAIRILRELAPRIEKRMGSWLAANELRNMLICNEDSEFYEWHAGSPISAKSIKKYLRDAGVEHRRDRHGSHYSLKDLNELVKRYVA